MTVQIENIEGKIVLILPPELLEKMNAREGDILDVTTTPNGLELRLADREMKEQIAVLRHVARKNRAALSRLAQ